MAGAAGAGAGLGIMGGILGGVGDIMQAANYEQPSLAPATGMEQRLRQLAQSQLLGGGQQLLGATALYNQMAPILMGMLPGMTYHPGTGDTGGGGGGGGMGDYAGALGNMQGAQQLQQQLTEAKATRKGAKKGPERRAARQEVKGLKRQIKSQPSVAQRERQAYTAGAQPGSFDIRQSQQQAPMAPTGLTSLGDINALMGGGTNLLDLYRMGAGG